MGQLGRAALKAFFEAGDTPTESQFVDLIDSMLNIIDDNNCFWQKVTLNFDDFQPDAGTVKYIDAFNVPAGYQLHRTISRATIRFLGGPITDAFIQFFDPTDTVDYLSSNQNVFDPITNKTGKVTPGYITNDKYLIDWVAGGNVRARLTVAGPLAEINDLTQGSIDIYYKLDKLV